MSLEGVHRTWTCGLDVHVCVRVCVYVRSLKGESKPSVGRGGGSLEGGGHLSP